MEKIAMVKIVLPDDRLCTYEFHYGAYDGSQFTCWSCFPFSPPERLSITDRDSSGKCVTHHYRFDNECGEDGGYVAENR